MLTVVGLPDNIQDNQLNLISDKQYMISISMCHAIFGTFYAKKKKKKKRIGESKAQALLNLINITKIPPKVHIYLPSPLA